VLRVDDDLHLSVLPATMRSKGRQAARKLDHRISQCSCRGDPGLMRVRFSWHAGARARSADELLMACAGIAHGTA
jgi:hypothetical protein